MFVLKPYAPQASEYESIFGFSFNTHLTLSSSAENHSVNKYKMGICSILVFIYTNGSCDVMQELGGKNYSLVTIVVIEHHLSGDES